MLPASPLGGIVPTVGGAAQAYAPDCDELRRKAEAAKAGSQIMGVTAAVAILTPLTPVAAGSAILAIILDGMSDHYEDEAEAMGCG